MAGLPLVNDVLKCQLKRVSAADDAVTVASAELARLQTLFPSAVCDRGKPGAVQEALRGSYLRLPPEYGAEAAGASRRKTGRSITGGRRPAWYSRSAT